MRAKDHFIEMARIENAISSKQLMAETYRSMASCTSAPPITDMPKNPNRNLEPMAKALIRAMELEEEIKELEERLEAMKLKALRIMDKFNCDHLQAVLVKRYFEKKSWSRIQDEMFYSRSGIYKLHGQALLAFELLEDDNLQKVDLSRPK